MKVFALFIVEYDPEDNIVFDLKGVYKTKPTVKYIVDNFMPFLYHDREERVTKSSDAFTIYYNRTKVPESFHFERKPKGEFVIEELTLQ